MDLAQEVAVWLRSTLPKSGAVEAVYASTAGAGGVRVGYNLTDGSWYWLDSNSLTIHVPGQDTVVWTLRDNAKVLVKPFHGDDCGVAEFFPIVSVIDLVARPDVVQSATFRPDGGLVVVAHYPLGSRCSDPQFPSAEGATWTYHLSAGGVVEIIERDAAQGSSVSVFSYAPHSPKGFGAATFAYSGALRLEELNHSPDVPPDFLSFSRLRSEVSKQNRAVEAQLRSTTPSGSKESSTTAPATTATIYNPLSQFAFPAILTGVAVLAVVGYALWRRLR